MEVIADDEDGNTVRVPMTGSSLPFGMEVIADLGITALSQPSKD